MTKADAGHLYIGLMSGTSVDGIDAALIHCHNSHIELLAHHSLDFPDTMRQQILTLCTEGANEIHQMAILDRQLGEHFALAAQQLLDQQQLKPSRVRAIGSHGQTIRHQPQSSAQAYSVQIGDPNTIAQLTGITTVADFRRRDIALGGEGAPLVPAFHQAVFSSPASDRVIVNIGGMANISILTSDKQYCGFDTGPGNVLMDAWINRHQGKSFDKDGQWALSGRINSTLLERLLSHPFFQQRPPKSTGRETFNLNWLEQALSECTADVSPEDVQATLLEATAQSVCEAIQQHAQTAQEVYVCGGGALNGALMKRLTELLPNRTLASCEALGIAPQWVEAAAFAWLAQQTLNGLPGNAPSVTGASKSSILGGIYPA